MDQIEVVRGGGDDAAALEEAVAEAAAVRAPAADLERARGRLAALRKRVEGARRERRAVYQRAARVAIAWWRRHSKDCIPTIA